jgi:hypothetical protein
MIPSLGISNACDRPLDEQYRAGPDVRTTLQGRFRVLDLAKIQKTIVDHVVQEEQIPISTSGVIYPLAATKLVLKPEGQRSWEWKELWATSDLVLKTDDRIIYRGVKYRIMSQIDWSDNGAVGYELVKDYEQQPRV